jgi:hypothetical protein
VKLSTDSTDRSVLKVYKSQYPQRAGILSVQQAEWKTEGRN